MSTARQTFWARLEAFRNALAEPATIAVAPSDVVRNARAQILRNGLAVVGFAVLEDFVKTRTSEVLGRIGTGATIFDDLPDKLRLAATSGVVRGLSFQSQFYDSGSPDYFSFYWDHASFVASTKGKRYSISGLAFAHDKSNVNAEQIGGILSAFKIAGGWGAMEDVASRSNATVLGMKGVFHQAAKRRHEAAHRASASVPSADLHSFGTSVTGIALSFDLLLSRALMLIRRRDAAYLSAGGDVQASHVVVRRVTESGSSWIETDPRSGATFTSSALRRLLPAAKRRARAADEAVVVIGGSGRPESWYFPPGE